MNEIIMKPAFADLLARAHRALSAAPPLLPPSIRAEAGSLAGELAELLQARNGFYSLGAALHVFPAESTELSWGLVDWNMPGLWKHAYASFVDPGVCFAEDIFGNQFSIKEGAVHHFAVETGTLERMAPSLAEWAAMLAADDGTWSGWALCPALDGTAWPDPSAQTPPPGHSVRLRRRL
jgi:hypothetical protein